MSGIDERPTKKVRRSTFESVRDLRPNHCPTCGRAGGYLVENAIIIDINDRITTYKYICSNCGNAIGVVTVGGIVVS